MTVKKDSLHAGHRARMREKLLRHGREVFHSHELLEMLLFYAIPYKNTNDLARSLLLRFGTLDGVFSATREELTEVKGIGPKIADMLICVGQISCLDAHRDNHAPRAFQDYSELGSFFVEYFDDSEQYGVAVMMLNNKMEMVSCDRICDCDYDSARVKPEPFLDAAVRSNAAIAVIAHNHPFGPKFPTPGDVATNTLISSALGRAGISLLEHYIISGREYIGFMKHLDTAFAQSAAIERFLRSKV